jgi:hypothetical protein
VAEVDKIPSGYQPCQLVKIYRRSWDHLRPHHHILVKLRTREGFIEICGSQNNTEYKSFAHDVLL